MRVITVARKPMSTSAAECAVEWGTSAMHIDGCRVQYQSQADRREETRGVHVGGAYEHVGGPAFKKAVNPVAAAHDLGRWPPNVIFQHHATCEIVGEREVRTGVAVRENSGGKTIFSETYKPPMENMTYGARGKEAIPDWACAEGCPVPDLDTQSGISTSKGHVRNNAGSWKVRKRGNATAAVETPHTDTGGASRFFKQVKP